MVKERAKFKEQRVKDCLRYEKESRALWEAQRKLPLIPLEKPIRHGWERFYVLRPDLHKHKHHKALMTILAMLGTTAWCDRKDFMRKKWNGKKLVPVEQDLKHLSEKEYEKLDEKLKPWFTRTLHHSRWGGWTYYVYVFTHPQFFVFKIKTFYYTHRQAVDGELESKAKYADNKAYYWPSFLVRHKDSFSAGRWYDRYGDDPKNQRADVNYKEQLKELDLARDRAEERLRKHDDEQG